MRMRLGGQWHRLLFLVSLACYSQHSNVEVAKDRLLFLFYQSAISQKLADRKEIIYQQFTIHVLW